MAPKPTYETADHDFEGVSPKDRRLLEITAIINVVILSIAGVAVTWCSYQAAVVANDSDKMRFYTDRVRPELGTILTSWLQQDPLHNKNGPAHPGVTEGYRKLLASKYAQMDSLQTQGSESWQYAEYANRTADNYVLITVIFSVVMFLGGVAPKVHIPKLTLGMSIASASICIIMLAILLIKNACCLQVAVKCASVSS